jgi:hypothetical protein
VEYYAGIDVPLELSSVCVVDAQGKIVKEAKVSSEPEALVCFPGARFCGQADRTAFFATPVVAGPPLLLVSRRWAV